jgi:hypothetical protein
MTEKKLLLALKRGHLPLHLRIEVVRVMRK